MDESPKPPDGSSVIEGLRRALDTAARCIDLAKQEAARIEASFQAQSVGGAQVEQTFLDNTRKRREQLVRSSGLLFEVPTVSLPQEPPPPAPLSLAETGDPSEAESLVPELLVQA
jgi:hypothetical protein